MKPQLRIPGSLIAALCLTPLAAYSATWDAGGSPSFAWSAYANWGDDASPAGKDVAFSSAGLVGNASLVSNQVTEDVTVQSLLYQYDSGANFHVTEIASGVTLGITGGASALTVGNILQSGTYSTSAVIKGDGALVVNQSGGTILVSNARSASAGNTQSFASLDLSGLAQFSASLGAAGSLNVGTNTQPSGANQRSLAVLTLADTNTITAGTIRVAAVTSDNQISVGFSNDPSSTTTKLFLGRENTIFTDTVDIGVGVTSSANGLVKFGSSVVGGTLKLRASTGLEDGAVELVRVGVNRGSGTSNSQYGELDLTGGEVDALITTLLVGRATTSGATSRADGVVRMDLGKMIVGDTTLGSASGSGTTDNATSGKLFVAGGEFETSTLVLGDSTGTGSGTTAKVLGELTVSGAGTVEVDSGIVMGRHAHINNAAAITANLQLLGGSLSVKGDIAEGLGGGSITSSINLAGGTLDLNGNAISVDQFTLTSGTLRNLAQFNSGAALVKTGVGTLVVEGVNTHTGLTDVQAGTLVLDGSLAAGARMANDTVLSGNGGSIGGLLTMEEGSSFSFTLESSTVYGHLSATSVELESDVNLDLALLYAPLDGETFTLVSGGPVSGLISSINGEALVGNTFSLSFGGNDYEFALSYGANNLIQVAAVPEPSSIAFGGLALLSGAALLRRRRR